MNDRALAYLESLFHNYENIEVHLSYVRDSFQDIYGKKRRAVPATALGKIIDIGHAIRRIYWELNHFLSEYDGRSPESRAYASQEQAFQDALRAMEAKAKERIREETRRLEQEVESLRKEAGSLREEAGVLRKENEDLKYRETRWTQALGRLQAENAHMQKTLENVESRTPDPAAIRTALEERLKYAYEQHNLEKKKLQDQIYQLIAEKRTLASTHERLKADNSQCETRLQQEAEAYRRELQQKETENAALKAQLRKLLEEKARWPQDDKGQSAEGQKMPTVAGQKSQERVAPPLEAAPPGLKDVTAPLGPKNLAAKEELALIKKFLLPGVDAPLKGSKAEMLARIEAATDMEEITAFLASQVNPSASSYMDTLKKCASKLEKLLKKAARMDEDEYLSEELSREYFKIISDVVLSNIMGGIYRNYRRDSQFYGNLLNLVNKWVSRCGIYSRMVLAGAKPCDQDYEDMTFITKTVNEPDRHGYIERVERLPYYVNFLEDDGTESSYHSEGIAITLKYAGTKEQDRNGAK